MAKASPSYEYLPLKFTKIALSVAKLPNIFLNILETRARLTETKQGSAVAVGINSV
jgi:hypothetical protein